MVVSNAIDNFDASLRKNIYIFRQRVYKIENNLIKCLNNCKDILNDPMWSSWSQALYCQRQQTYSPPACGDFFFSIEFFTECF